MSINNDICFRAEKFFALSTEFLLEKEAPESFLSKRNLGLYGGVGFVSRKLFEDNSGLFSEEVRDGLAKALIDRVIFPCRLPSGEIYGFVGRSIEDSGSKYLAYPIDKSIPFASLIFGLAQPLMKASKSLWIVEGIFDAISVFSLGECAIAMLGAKVTLYQAIIIAAMRKDVFICFDSDKAGRLAIRPAIESLAVFNIRPVIVFPATGLDPDETVRTNQCFSFWSLERFLALFDDWEKTVSVYSDDDLKREISNKISLERAKR